MNGVTAMSVRNRWSHKPFGFEDLKSCLHVLSAAQKTKHSLVAPFMSPHGFFQTERFEILHYRFLLKKSNDIARLCQTSIYASRGLCRLNLPSTIISPWLCAASHCCTFTNCCGFACRCKTRQIWAKYFKTQAEVKQFLMNIIPITGSWTHLMNYARR